MNWGIERIGFYGGRAFIDIAELAVLRHLDPVRMANLLIRRKTVHFPWEDPVSFAVNAARPLVRALPEAQRGAITHLIVASESGIDFGKSLATWVHGLLDLPRAMRLFEIKQACYGGTAALQTALGLLARQARPEAKALVICTDIARPIPHSYAEPTQGGAAIALLLGGEPDILELEPGASGLHGYHVMDALRPDPDQETGDADLSVLTYIDCLQQAFAAYREAVGPVDFRSHFDYLAFHTPFGGMVKGAHRSLLRRWYQANGAETEADFHRRLAPSLAYCREVGNIYSGTVFLALAGALASADLDRRRRIGLFSYGSGCSAEFYSGWADHRAETALALADLPGQLAARHKLGMVDYERVLTANRRSRFGEREARIDPGDLADLYETVFAGRGVCVLRGIHQYEREYRDA
ncbi:hydroxymethylglutaryl-CoA synthase [Methylomagnum ishizawai]|uniref:Hydroxymethylglutaryl-CoA synthase n=1 Tax=Methylomagnum ishizawai TaxID=1760988 RepID=A0A1Y6DAH0_9GAMM|nr:hydroxymethylglutaryl-CoA synthase [Methylomagnum ishizawai]SMF97332.1 hydroxymethylglutaryl-CoA synthase [Methylomagnum ishizawai]